MRSKRIVTENEKYGNQFRDKERARAIELLVKSDDFIVIVKKGIHNECVTAIEAKNLPFMAFNCNKLTTELVATMEAIDRQIKKEKDDKMQS